MDYYNENYDVNGFNRHGLHRNGTIYDCDGYDKDGDYNLNGPEWD